MTKVPGYETCMSVHVDGGATKVRNAILFHTVASQDQLNAKGVIFVKVCNK